MRLVKVQLSDSTSLPVLVRNDPFTPILVPFIYNIVRLKGKAENTKRNIFTSIKYFYSFIESEYGLDVDELLITGSLDSLIDRIDEFVYWIGVQDTSVRTISNPQTRDAHLRNLKDYFSWAATRYINSDSVLQRVRDRIEGTFAGSKIFTPSKRFMYRSLVDGDVKLIETISHPSDSLNPFRNTNRFRNWLIIQFLLKLGLRLGELLTLQCKDIYKYESGSFYVQILDTGNSFDTRKQKPSLKNQSSRRTVSIDEGLYNASIHYIQNLRRPMRYGKPMKIKNGFLFLSDRGEPISAGNVNDILKKLAVVAKKQSATFDSALSPHVFRHTFAENFLRYLIETLCFDMERAKDHLRSICGWSASSPMPGFYGARYISEKANSENVKRIQALRK